MDPILSSILGPVCERLIDAAIEEYRLVRGVKEEIMNLHRTVSMIKGVLEDAERKKVEHGAIRIWLKSLKQILFDAEDVFDEIATEEALERDAEDGTTRCAIVTRRLSKVLKLKGCELLGTLPPNTSALVNLRHLELDTEIASCVPWLGKLTALQELILNGSKVGELADMGMLKDLRIWGLEGVASKEEAVGARLEAKEHLELLELKWGRDSLWDDGSSDDSPRQHSVEEEEVVDALKPVNRIRRLCVRSYEGARSPKWMGDPSWVSTSLLVKVKLFNCTKWEVLPPLGQLPGLKVLEIWGMWGVRRIGPEFFFSCCCCDDGEGGVKLAPGFPSLEELEFEYMPEWEEWESPVVLLDQQQQLKQHPLLFPRLHTLVLFYCEKLRELPPLPPTLTKLSLKKVGLTRLPGWMERCSEDVIGRDVVIMPSTSSPSLLSTLVIDDCPNMTSLGDGLLQRPLRMLKKLKIEYCEELRSLGDAAGLVSLEDLEISNCPKLLHLVEGAAVMSSPSAPSASSPIVPSTVVAKIISLKSLKISNCSAITTPPCSSEALESLTIEHCGELRSLGAAAGLVSLEYLSIGNCPKLLHLVEEGAAAVMSSSPVIPSPTVVAKIISLKTLKTQWCSPKQIATWLCQVSSLQELYISYCPQLRCFGAGDDDTINAGDLDLDLDLEGALLDLAPSLRKLHLDHCENLSSLPSKLRSLTRLETLWIQKCPKIQRLPSAGLPQTLKELVIRECPELEQRCREEGCPDWPLLSHIPRVDIRGYRR